MIAYHYHKEMQKADIGRQIATVIQSKKCDLPNGFGRPPDRNLRLLDLIGVMELPFIIPFVTCLLENLPAFFGIVLNGKFDVVGIVPGLVARRYG